MFREAIELTHWRRTNDGWSCDPAHVAQEFSLLEKIYQAMMLGLKDYVNKNRFPGVILGLSGGIDSALTAAVAVDALGADKVRAVMMPSPYTSRDSLEDAEACAKALGISYEVDLDRAGDEGVRRDAGASRSPAATPTPPRRTSRAAPAASP